MFESFRACGEESATMQATYVDTVLHCRDCGSDFTWTVGEQAFYAVKGLEHAPSRCSTCRVAVRQARQAGRPVSGSRTREFFPVVCAQCGVQTQVPFSPRDDRPVYCSSCYDAVRAQGSVFSAR
ncbi:MAG: hypothetical protein PVSMB7_09000 [Chloroflexota bacterium]